MSNFIFDQGERVPVGRSQENTFVFAEGEVVNDSQVSELAFIEGRGIGAGSLVRATTDEGRSSSHPDFDADATITPFSDFSEYFVFVQNNEAVSESSTAYAYSVTETIFSVEQVEEIFVEWEFDIETNENNQIQVSCAIDEDREELLTSDNSFYDDTLAGTGQTSSGFSRRVDSFDVSGVSGDVFLGVGSSVSSDYGHEGTGTVWDVWGESGGERILDIILPHQ